MEESPLPIPPIRQPVDRLMLASFLTLPAKQPVTIVGFLENVVDLSSAEKSQSIWASIVYGGTYEKFASQTRIKGGIAAGMTLLNILAAIVIGVGPLLECGRSMKKELATN